MPLGTPTPPALLPSVSIPAVWTRPEPFGVQPMAPAVPAWPTVRAGSIITDALRLIGWLRVGQTAAPAELAEGLIILNAMLESWDTEGLNIVVVGSARYDLVTATGSYTIGPGGDFNALRPLAITRATLYAGGVRIGPLRLLKPEEWAAITEPAAQSTAPRLLYYDRAFPLGLLNLWPVPTFTGTAPQLELYTWSALPAFPDVDTTAVALAPGYDAALRYGLALMLASRFRVKPSEALVSAAAESKATIQALNAARFEVNGGTVS